MEAEIDGPQRTVLSSEVKPAKRMHGEAGIPLRGGRTLGFVVARSWVAPAGYYEEGWYLVDPATREVLYEEPPRLAQIWGLQGLTELRTQVTEPIALAPGKYLIVFALGGIKGGELEVEAAEVSARKEAA